ncbi:unnamed protein product [Echinostoma caproni]|uniref:Pre-mRNA-splicing factor SLU7 n=1 Tax=Echinostoma caproni TaxID=27848 RepID=A0A183ASY6_9TREM|nr:unnamed protein product [Echinostoma caproni]
MSFVPNFPPSLLQRVKEAGGSDEKKKSKENYKKMKELEEARKLAVMPAMKDEEGRDINPHIPQYIMQAPWYYGALHPTLRHQRIQDEQKREEASGKMKGSTSLNAWYKRGAPQKTKALKYRDGACENCGSLTHKRKDCMERPRKVGAKYTGLDIAADDYQQEEIQLGYEAKRDRWNGYDPAEHKKLFDEYQRLEEARKLAKAKKLEEKLAKAAEGNGGQEEPAASAAKPTLDEDGDLDMDDGDRYGDELDMPGQKFDSKQRQSIRNLRIREDTAKYLFNLDPNSAYYDPKTRAMRENPFENSGKPESEVPFAGDNFVRFDGEVQDMVRRQVFAWEMHNKLGLDVHLQADPTRLELLAKKVQKAKSDVQSRVREEILDRYGGHEHLEALPAELRLGQWETYAEYSPTGRIIKGAEKPTVKSRYEEDTVWGSYWFNGQWGYKCCHSLLKESYCMGEKNKAVDNPEVPDDPTGGALLKPPPMPSEVSSSDGETRCARKSQRSNDHHRKRPRSDCSNASSRSSSSSFSSCTSSSSCSSSENSSSDNEETSDQKKAVESASTSEPASEPSKTEQQRLIEEAKASVLQALKKARSGTHRKKRSVKKTEQKRSKRENKGKDEKKRFRSSSSSASNASTVDLDTLQEQKIKKAIKQEKARLKQVEAYLSMDERKRPYNSLVETKEPTAEEMEAYYRTRVNRDDPMAPFM